MKTAAQLSEIEQKVYDIIKASGSIWQYKITDQLWPRVIYSPTTQAANSGKVVSLFNLSQLVNAR